MTASQPPGVDRACGLICAGTRAARNEILIGGTREEMQGFFATDPAMTSLANPIHLSSKSQSKRVAGYHVANRAALVRRQNAGGDGSTFLQRLRHT